MDVTGAIRPLGHAVALPLLAFVLVACGGGGDGGDGARPTVSPTRTPTATRPTTDEPTEQPSEQPTEQPTEEPTTGVPSPTRTPDATTSPEPSQTAEESTPSEPEPTTGTPSTEPEAEGADTEQVEEEGVPAWAWWLLTAAVLGAVVAVPLVVRARRRKDWQQQLAEQEGEVAWVARSLLPGLRSSGSLEQVAGGWSVAEARVAAAEDRLTVLESEAHGDADRARARSLRDAVRLSRAGMRRLLGPGPHGTWALDLDSVIADLEAALRRSPITSPQ